MILSFHGINNYISHAVIAINRKLSGGGSYNNIILVQVMYAYTQRKVNILIMDEH